MFTLDQNECSRSSRIGVHVEPEYASPAWGMHTAESGIAGIGVGPAQVIEYTELTHLNLPIFSLSSSISY